ncbi:MAG: hypothetical protein R2838_11195 [Caldilineaceae bacterium]
MIHALAECGAVLGNRDAQTAARRRGHVHLDQHAPARRASLPQLQGRAFRFNAYLEDYAALVRG